MKTLDELILENKWIEISIYIKLSEDFIDMNHSRVSWYYICQNQKLSEKFIEKHKDKVWWDIISEYQILSEKFIEKYKDKVNWYNIVIYQKISKNFILKHYKPSLATSTFFQTYFSHHIVYDTKINSNICIICNSIMHELHLKNCNEALMERALK